MTTLESGQDEAVMTDTQTREHGETDRAERNRQAIERADRELEEIRRTLEESERSAESNRRVLRRAGYLR